MTINCLGKLIDMSTPKVMGILNVTPDSFYDGGKHNSLSKIEKQVRKMLTDGADIIDIGGYSSKPGASEVSLEEELHRVLPVVAFLTKNFKDIIISIDTFRSEVAKAALDKGAAIINDISAGTLDSPEMLKTIASYNVPYIMMHTRGTPQNMQNLTDYNHLLQEIVFYFSEKIAAARSLGIHDLIIDPGFGFAKTIDQNFELLYNLPLLKSLEAPILTGVSRKSMIYKTLNTSSQQALNGSTALHMFALEKGTQLLRVHDVLEAKQCVQLFNKLQECGQNQLKK